MIYLLKFYEGQNGHPIQEIHWATVELRLSYYKMFLISDTGHLEQQKVDKGWGLDT